MLQGFHEDCVPPVGRAVAPDGTGWGDNSTRVNQDVIDIITG